MGYFLQSESFIIVLNVFLFRVYRTYYCYDGSKDKYVTIIVYRILNGLLSRIKSVFTMDF